MATLQQLLAAGHGPALLLPAGALGRTHLSVMSHQALLKAGAAVAAQLCVLQLPRNAVVALVATHSAESVVAMVGVVAAGWACAPLNPATRSPTDLSFLLTDVKASVLLVRAWAVAAWLHLAARRPWPASDAACRAKQVPPADQADTAQAVAAAAGLGIPVCRMAPLDFSSGRLELLLEQQGGQQEPGLPPPAPAMAREGSGLASSLSRRMSGSTAAR